MTIDNHRAAEPVLCDYCQQSAELVDSVVVYGRSYGMIWLCRPCDAYVGVHKNSPRHAPLGRLANAELRYWKRRAHAAFDPLWQRKMARDRVSKSEARKLAYHWLAEQLGLSVQQCHIGMFDVATCQRVMEICAPYGRKR